MGQLHFVALGVALGLLSSVPSGVLFLRALQGRHVGMGAGLASVLASFALMSVAVLAVRLQRREMTLVFGAALACSFLAVWAAGGMCALGKANPRRHNEGE